MTDRDFLRHTIAVSGYRAGKTMRGALESFATYGRAEIVVGRVGQEQGPPDPKREFD